MNYSPKSYEAIFESMLQDSLKLGLISHAEDFEDYLANKEDISNYYVMDKAVIATMFARAYLDITRIYESAKVEYAEGTDLDAIGLIVGVERPSATKSMVNVTFTLPSVYEEDILISKGLILTTSNGLEYETISDIYFPAGNTVASAECRSIKAGPNTKINKNTLTLISGNNPYNMTCNNSNKSSGGNPAYTDDEYRYLLMNWYKIRLKGSLEAYEYFFSHLDGIDDYRIVPNWDGSGTIKIIVDPGDFLNEVYQELQSTVCQASEVITLFKPSNKFIKVKASVNVDIDQINPYSENEKLDIQSKIINATKIFIDGGYLIQGGTKKWYPGLGLGEDFVPHKLAVFLDSEIPELKNIIFEDNSNIVILDEEKGISDEIIIEMV